MCRPFMMVTLCLVSFTACADEASPVVVKRGTLPLVTDLEQRLARTDGFMQGLVQRPVEPTDSYFVRVMSRNLARDIQPAFPECVPGVELLLEHADLRIRYVGLKLLTDGVESQRKATTKLDSETSTRLRGRCLSLLEDAAQGKSSPVLCDLAADLFVTLSSKQTTEEENQSLQELLSAKEVLARKAALDVLLTIQTTGPDETLCQHIEQLIQSDSVVDQQWMVQRLSECPVVSVPLRETICRALRREPKVQETKSLALLLAKTRPVPPEALPGLIEAITQPVAFRQAGGMCCSSQPDVKGDLVANEYRIASSALSKLDHTDIAAVPVLIRLLDHPQMEVRRQAVAHLRQFGSLAIVALPKLLTLNTHDKRPVVMGRHSWSFPGPSFQSEVNGAVQSISWSTLSKLNVPLKYRVVVAICLKEGFLRAENKTLLVETASGLQFAWMLIKTSADK